MSQQEKGELWRKLKAAGVEFTNHYRDYSTEDLQKAWDAWQAEQAPPPPDPVEEVSDAEAAAFFGQTVSQPESDRPELDGLKLQQAEAVSKVQASAAPVRPKDENEMPGQRLNQSVELTPIRTDNEGRVWYQEEVLKPAYPKPRGRRVLQYMDGGVEKKTVQDGEYVETFEVAGVANRRPAEVKITLPSYQVGIYKDRRFPFKIHTYNGIQGFDLFEVQDYYGGAEMVPETVKRMYVENVLCYDIRTTVRDIQTQFRQLQLQGKVK
jgi:hypothetical protein